LQTNDEGRFIVKIGGLEDLKEADLSNVKAQVEGSSVPMRLLGRDTEPDVDGKSLVTLSFSFQAPSDLGAFAATVDLPAVARISDTGFVIER
jgi:hypothetical protein